LVAEFSAERSIPLVEIIETYRDEGASIEKSAGFWAVLFADFFDDVRRDWTGVPACRRKFWCRFLRFLYFALASVFVSHGG